MLYAIHAAICAQILNSRTGKLSGRLTVMLRNRNWGQSMLLGLDDNELCLDDPRRDRSDSKYSRRLLSAGSSHGRCQARHHFCDIGTIDRNSSIHIEQLRTGSNDKGFTFCHARQHIDTSTGGGGRVITSSSVSYAVITVAVDVAIAVAVVAVVFRNIRVV
jgi:hypothetical protein